MARYFNIGGPCNAADNYMLPAAERLPEVLSLIHKKQYFVIHAPRQCGKTTTFLSLANDLNAEGDFAALYCTVETVQEYPDPDRGLPFIANAIRHWAADTCPVFSGYSAAEIAEAVNDPDPTSCVLSTLKHLASKAGLINAFLQYWRENAGTLQNVNGFTEAIPHMVFQAFLQRVINGGGEIIRNMALGRKALDLGVIFKGQKFAIELKLKYYYDRWPEESTRQILGYMDQLGQAEGWLIVFDPDMTKSWDEKISAEDITSGARTIHLIRC